MGNRLVVAALLGTTGCSIGTMNHLDPGRPIGGEPRCTRSEIPAALDGLNVLGAEAEMAALFADPELGNSPVTTVLTGFEALFFAWSMTRGIAWRGECETAWREWNETHQAEMGR